MVPQETPQLREHWDARGSHGHQAEHLSVSYSAGVESLPGTTSSRQAREALNVILLFFASRRGRKPPLIPGNPWSLKRGAAFQGLIFCQGRPGLPPSGLRRAVGARTQSPNAEEQPPAPARVAGAAEWRASALRPLGTGRSRTTVGGGSQLRAGGQAWRQAVRG